MSADPFATSNGSTVPKDILNTALSTTLRDNQQLIGMMTTVERKALQEVITRVGTPDDYGTAAEYVFRAIPFVKGVYATMTLVAPLAPSPEEIAALMKPRTIPL